jgi:lactate dehydrogenase-like 2-hydroxyacid dehydrogenase
MHNLLQVGRFPQELQARIDKEFRCHAAESVASDPGLRSQMEGIITRSDSPIPEELIASLPNLKVISTSGVGFDRIPVKFANDRGIVVTNTPGVLTAAVCELAIGILLSLLREIPVADRFVRDGKWRTQIFPLTTSLSGKSVGIIGMGRIGQGIAARLAPFGVDLLYAGTCRPHLPYRYFADRYEMASASDILLVCVPGGAATKNLINASLLEALGPEGFLINMARGSVVDELALIHALKQRKIKGAGLDVFHDEPNINPEFFALSNVVLTPHLGSATRETREAMLCLALDNIRAVLSGAQPLTPVFG